MKRKWLAIPFICIFCIAIALVTPSTYALFLTANLKRDVAKPEIVILPIHKANILVGQKFDFRVEVNHGTVHSPDLKVTINHIDAEQFFGKKADRTHTQANSSEFTIRNVSFKRVSPIVIQASVEMNHETIMKKAAYDVYQAFGSTRKAKNVILMIGDGMSANIRTAARVVSQGMEQGKFKGWLEMEKMQNMGMVTTSGMDSIVTDSANSASAYATGNKTAVNAVGVYPDNTTDSLDDPRIENIVELVKRTRGMATGLVTTADITDATPAAMATHTRHRSTSEEIVNMFYGIGSRPDILMGGGREWFLPLDQGGKRKDNKNMINLFKSQGYSYVSNRTELSQLPKTNQILGLFRTGHMNVYFDREYTKPKNPKIVGEFTDQPTLMDMASQALKTLGQNRHGFFLMVEGASIDKMAHLMDFERCIWDTIEFDKTVGIAKQFAEKHKDTLVIVTSDHGHSMTLNGTFQTTAKNEGRETLGVYEESKFPTYQDQNQDGFPDHPDPEWKITPGWGSHPDYNEDYLTNSEPKSPTTQDPNKGNPWYIANPLRDPQGEFYPGNIPHKEPVETHTFDDVPINTLGPGSELFTGYMDNTAVFRNMVTALKLIAQ